ncbi:MAG: hypothetical protein E6J79_10455 [Deltaproteobacteria bacterium]|nr:MAG: hypothetical protein E6J79_10455 [Deltaproteobacteria bacterium]
MSRFATLLVTALLVLLAPARSSALYHLAHISEVMSGITGDPTVQFVEIRMDSGFQNFVGNTRLTAFDCTGTTATVLLTIPPPATMAGQVPNQGAGRHWIMGTSMLAAATTPSVTPDFTMTAGIPTACGMVCWGGPADPMTLTSKDPSTWSASDPDNYIDCVAYGPYTGPQRTVCAATPPASGTPGGGTFSLTRNTNSCNDFPLACPTPTNNGPPMGAEVMGTFGPCTPPTTTTSTTTTTTTTVTSTTLTFGGDDTGCVPDTKGHLKCGDGLGKAFGNALRAVIKCHQKQAHAAFAGTPADDEPCEDGTGTGKSAREKLDAAIAKLAVMCSAQQLSAVTTEETTLFASQSNPASLDAQNGNVYCDGATSVDPGGDDAGTVDAAAADAKNKLKCADTVGLELGKLAAAVIKCHQKAADARFALKPFDEEACEETDPIKHKAAHDKYNAAMDKLDLKGICTQTCLSRTNRDALGVNVVSQIEAANEVAYPCP